MEYQFVGGSLDGQRLRINNARIGLPWRTETQPGRQTEIYTLNADDRFHFVRYGLGFNVVRNELQFSADLQPIQQQLAELLLSLDTILAEHGGPDATVYRIGNWIIQHEDA